MKVEAFTGTLAELEDGLKAAVRLNNGVMMPWLGLGVYKLAPTDGMAAAVRHALARGYRSIDTATIYGNERGVGEAIRSSGVPRGELFVTTKVWNDDMRADRVEAAFSESLGRLGLDYVDLYLLHWPIKGKAVASWRALERMQRSGRIRAIGVSNFMRPHLDELLGVAEIVPAVNQIEFHPYLQSPTLVSHCQALGIRVESWSPLMQGRAVLQDPVLVGIAARHGRTVAQVILRWNVQSGIVTIPKTGTPSRMDENARVFDFALAAGELAAIGRLDRNERIGPDPLNFNF
jgi:diketogulonate reductase-like aldo/keto reductase